MVRFTLPARRLLRPLRHLFGKNAFYTRWQARQRRQEQIQDQQQEFERLHTKIAMLTPELDRLAGENGFYARRLAELDQHNRILTEAATERAQTVQDQQKELERLHTKIATLTPAVDRLTGENGFYARRFAELEEHHRALTEAATERALSVQNQQQELERLHNQIATLTPEVDRLAGQNAFYARRLAELEEHHRALTEAATERAQTVQDQQQELERLHTRIATLTPELDRLTGENSFYARRLKELEEHNHSLTEAATERAQRVHDLERQIATLDHREGTSRAPSREDEGSDGQARRSSLPSMMVVSIPKSGTVFTRTMLMRGLGLQPLTFSVGAFPHYSIDAYKLQEFQRGGMMVSTHLDASAENLQFLAAFVDRWVVHIRDPRSVLLSWVHHLQRLYKARHAGINELLLVCPTPPETLFDRGFSEQVDWNIENFLPCVVTWIRQWLTACDSDANKILVTTYSDLLASEEQFLFKILDFYGVARHHLANVTLERSIEASHFRTGRPDEWRDSLSSRQISRMAKLIGDDLLARFEWPSA